MRSLSLAVGIAALCVTSASADVTAPGDVKFSDGVVSASLTGVPGDPVAGRSVFSGRKLGNCLACHQNADMPEQSFHGEVGPAITGVANRWEEGQLRAILVNSKMVFEGTIMPAFYRDTGYERTLEKFQGKTILTAQQVEDVIAYLQTLTEE